MIVKGTVKRTAYLFRGQRAVHGAQQGHKLPRGVAEWCNATAVVYDRDRGCSKECSCSTTPSRWIHGQKEGINVGLVAGTTSFCL